MTVLLLEMSLLRWFSVEDALWRLFRHSMESFPWGRPGSRSGILYHILPEIVSDEAEGYGGVTGLFPFSYTVPPSPRRAAEAGRIPLNFAGFMKADFLCKTSRAS